MGIGLGPAGSRNSRSTPTTLSEINVTPLVDVMLVLLIVFMVSAPLMQQGIQIDLPRTKGGALNEVQDKYVLEIGKDLVIKLNGKAIPKGALQTRLEAIVSVKPEVQIFVQADRTISYGIVAQVMAEVRAAKVSRVGLVTVPGDANDRL